MTKKETLIMDPLHGFINISEYPVVEQIVETKYFQRLRRLAQLGLASAVYPNATHSRFTHCLGVMHVFLNLFDSILRREEKDFPNRDYQRKVGAVTALVHDIGHGPFSHASESILDKKFGGFVHEKMTCEIVTKTEISDPLKKDGIDPDDVCNIINHISSKDWRLVSQLISSQLDADRLDYLKRDSYFSGVSYGDIELDRIANTLEIWHGSSGDPFDGIAVVNPKGVPAIENYIQGRYLMYEGVYFHKLTRCMEFLLDNVFKRASELDDKKTDLSQVIDITKQTTPELLYKMDDSSCMGLFHKWVESDDNVLLDLSKRILERRRLASVTLTIEKYTDLGAVKIGQLPDLVEKAGLPKDYYFIEDSYQKSAYDVYSVDQVTREEFDPTLHIMTPNEDNQLVEISSQSSVIQTLSQTHSKKIRSFVPEEVLPGVKQIVNG